MGIVSMLKVGDNAITSTEIVVPSITSEKETMFSSLPNHVPFSGDSKKSQQVGNTTLVAYMTSDIVSMRVNLVDDFP